ncbi:DUF3526 domain-containing protein [uncultured Pseudoteredinibacter sp.]|uniref:DUF3526 domain-containing protein n=1 Tax=uncultured Pseudoteredinibacter sp. TaxID=1641701 RepID=UPI0026059A5B|nr:DUF3526 domain-containing protein [uncultured Pseudoteredinibacter sp.]
MKQILLIAAGEWRYWLRSRLALGSAVIFLLLFTVTSVLSSLHIEAQSHARGEHQTEAEDTFLAQPDRHPHRMVHYGHYLFRTAAPLASFDPGLDMVTGQSIFLEGHRQNTVMFAESAASADFGGLSWLSPALVYQLFAPLIIILLGYGSIAREREASVLAPLMALGVSGQQLVAGKALALLSFVLLLLCPLLLSSSVALSKGESLNALLLLTGFYFIYLSLWLVLTLLASTIFIKRANVLLTLFGLWLGLNLVLPSLAVNAISGTAPTAGKIESDLTMLADLRKLGDGHNANDPAFTKLKADLLAKHGVENVADLPVNFRGIVAMYSEKKLSQVLNEYANNRMTAELQQEQNLQRYGWFSPALAIAAASRAIAGTDLNHYHLFQTQAEEVRFNFVQGLNRAHAEVLSYQNDINRNADAAAWAKARVDASNWQVLEAYKFQTAALLERYSNAYPALQMLLIWLMLVTGILFWRGGSIKP